MTPEHDLDLGIVIGSTNEDIWEAEMRRHDGLIVLRRMTAAAIATLKLEGVTPRQRLQRNFAGLPHKVAAEALLNVMQQMAPLLNASNEEADRVVKDKLEHAQKQFAIDYPEVAASPLLSALMKVR